MVVLLHLLYSTNWEALCEGVFVVGGKTRVQLNAKMLQAVNRYLSSQRVPLLSQEHNVDIYSRLHIRGMTLHSVRYIYVPCNLGICTISRLHCAFSES